MSDYEDDYDSDIEAGLTSVLLGYSGNDAGKSDLSVLGNHIGGSPVWFRNTPPPSQLLECIVCQKQTDLLCQLSCPLPEKDYDRSIYVFACADPNCRRKEGSVIAIRGIESNDEVKARIEAEGDEEAVENNVGPKEGTLGNSLFMGKSENAEEGETTSSNPFASANPFASSNIESAEAPSKSSKSKKKNKNKKKQAVQGKYPCKLLEVEEEYLERKSTEELLKGVKIEEAGDENTGSNAGASNAESSDLRALEANTDPAFIHFVEIVECNPDQVLRYERGLKPLIYSTTDGVAAKLNELKSHTLEVQLMPHLISELETPEMIAEGMEWGAIYVATDANDKLPTLNEHGVGYEKEWVVVQWEEERA